MREIINGMVEAGAKLFTYLTWNRVAMLCALVLIWIATKIFIDNQQAVYTALSVARFAENAIQIPPTSATQASIKTIVDRAVSIVAIEIVQVDFRTNTRAGVYFYSDQDALQNSYNLFQNDTLASSPLFIMGDSINNDRIVSIMETEFVCIPVDGVIINKIPAARKHAKQVCTISIPPDYGKMVGWLNFWLLDPIPRHLFAEYKQLARTLSAEIYHRDVNRAVK